MVPKNLMGMKHTAKPTRVSNSTSSYSGYNQRNEAHMTGLGTQVAEWIIRKKNLYLSEVMHLET